MPNAFDILGGFMSEAKTMRGEKLAKEHETFASQMAILTGWANNEKLQPQIRENAMKLIMDLNLETHGYKRSGSSNPLRKVMDQLVGPTPSEGVDLSSVFKGVGGGGPPQIGVGSGNSTTQVGATAPTQSMEMGPGVATAQYGLSPVPQGDGIFIDEVQQKREELGWQLGRDMGLAKMEEKRRAAEAEQGHQYRMEETAGTTKRTAVAGTTPGSSLLNSMKVDSTNTPIDPNIQYHIKTSPNGDITDAYPASTSGLTYGWSPDAESETGYSKIGTDPNGVIRSVTKDLEPGTYIRGSITESTAPIFLRQPDGSFIKIYNTRTTTRTTAGRGLQAIPTKQQGQLPQEGGKLTREQATAIGPAPTRRTPEGFEIIGGGLITPQLKVRMVAAKTNFDLTEQRIDKVLENAEVVNDLKNRGIIATTLTAANTGPGKFTQGLILQNASPKLRDYILELRNLRDDIFGMRQFLGNQPVRSDSQVKLLLAQVPDESAPDADWVRQALATYRFTVSILRKQVDSILKGGYVDDQDGMLFSAEDAQSSINQNFGPPEWRSVKGERLLVHQNKSTGKYEEMR